MKTRNEVKAWVEDIAGSPAGADTKNSALMCVVVDLLLDIRDLLAATNGLVMTPKEIHEALEFSVGVQGDAKETK